MSLKIRVMKSKIWFYLFWVLSIIVLIANFNSINWKGETEKIETEKNETEKNENICLMAIYKPKNIIVEKGDYFEADFIIGQFIPNKMNTQTIAINGAAYIPDEEGIVNFKIKTHSKGLKKLQVASNISRNKGFSNGKLFGSQSFKYYVIDSMN
jgi:hypothetical protein